MTLGNPQAELGATANLLNLVFGFRPPVDSSYLAWYYLDNPEGTAAVGRGYDGNRLTGNYALIPQRFQAATKSDVRLGLGVDLAVHPEFRGTGTYRRTVEASYRVGAADGLSGILGVANAQSVPRMTDTFGWRRLPDFRARFLTPIADGVRCSNHLVGPALLAGPLLDEALPQPTEPPPTGHGARWSTDLLRWRLARPGANYVLHLRDDVTFISVESRHGPFRVAVLLKVLARQSNIEPVSVGALAATLARHHRTPLVLHWGVSPLMQGRGIPLPRGLMPSPLGIVLHAFDDDGAPRLAEQDFTPTAFEFLDFDAY
ncbi:MAG: GNAT family N-acetyltransferase [Acidimicrobiales bacterium]|nr:GNAT family N-acetyltransferase [Acidimicrobiales bacterium]